MIVRDMSTLFDKVCSAINTSSKKVENVSGLSFVGAGYC